MTLTLDLLPEVGRYDEGSPRAYSRPLTLQAHLQNHDLEVVMDEERLDIDQPPTMTKSKDEFPTGANSCRLWYTFP